MNPYDSTHRIVTVVIINIVERYLTILANGDLVLLGDTEIVCYRGPQHLSTCLVRKLPREYGEFAADYKCFQLPEVSVCLDTNTASKPHS